MLTPSESAYAASYQGCGLGLDASVSKPSRGAVVPRPAVWLRLKFQTSRSCLDLEIDRLGLDLGLDTEGLGLGLGLGSKRLGLVDKHFSITYIKLCLNMPPRFSLSSRLPRSLTSFRTTSVLGMMWM